MSAWRVGGIVHALEGWEEHECGLEVPMANPPRVWEAATTRKQRYSDGHSDGK